MPRTTFSEIITDYAMVEIDDVRLNQDLAVSPARFYRKMCLYMNNAIPRFNRPPAVRGWLQYTPAQWDDYEYTAAENMASGSSFLTPVTGYGLASAVIQADDGCGNAVLLPLPISYDSNTGIITIRQEVTAGTQIEIDFYEDGVFKYELGNEIKRILGLCVQLVWENRFVNNFLLQQPKIKDRSFDVGSEGNHMNAGTSRLRMLTQQLNSELNAFEQLVAYTSINTNRPIAACGSFAPFVMEVNDESNSETTNKPSNDAFGGVTDDNEGDVGSVAGGYYIPVVDENGVLTWHASQNGMPVLPQTNIKGPKGDNGAKGDAYVLTEADKREIAGMVDVGGSNVTDTHIIALIDERLGVIENGTY